MSTSPTSTSAARCCDGMTITTSSVKILLANAPMTWLQRDGAGRDGRISARSYEPARYAGDGSRRARGGPAKPDMSYERRMIYGHARHDEKISLLGEELYCNNYIPLSFSPGTIPLSRYLFNSSPTETAVISSVSRRSHLRQADCLSGRARRRIEILDVSVSACIGEMSGRLADTVMYVDVPVLSLYKTESQWLGR